MQPEEAFCDIEVRDANVIITLGVRGSDATAYALTPSAALKIADILERAAWDAMGLEDE